MQMGLQLSSQRQHQSQDRPSNFSCSNKVRRVKLFTSSSNDTCLSKGPSSCNIVLLATLWIQGSYPPIHFTFEASPFRGVARPHRHSVPRRGTFVFLRHVGDKGARPKWPVETKIVKALAKRSGLTTRHPSWCQQGEKVGLGHQALQVQSKSPMPESAGVKDKDVG